MKAILPPQYLNTSSIYVGVFFAYERLELARNRISTDDLDKVLDEFCQIFDIDRKEILGPSRKGEISLARHLFFFAARQITRASFRILGNKANGREYSTVIHSCKLVKKYLQANDSKFMPLWH